MDLRLEDRTVLVTAASRGLGYAVARALIDEDANVVICGRNENSLKIATRELGSRATFIVADVSQEKDITRMMETIAKERDALDGLFVNAGGPPPGTFFEMTDEDWTKAFNLTLMSAVRLTRSAIPLLKKSSHPSILYSTSISVKQPIDNLLLSNAMRPAVIGLMRTLSTEIAPLGIRTNAVCPGYIDTERVQEILGSSGSARRSIEQSIPLGRIGTPDEFGALCAFLLSPLASYVHGSVISIDGGLYRGFM
ncbi:MAG: SDR family oxidoreductase [Candidatus Thorarchaeota archaeon]